MRRRVCVARHTPFPKATRSSPSFRTAGSIVHCMMSETLECRRCETPCDDGALFCHQCGDEFESPASADAHGRLRDRLSLILGDRYRVGELLGAGGMGVVFLAADLKHQRSVAIKVLSPTLAGDPKVVERFGREARTAAGLDHSGIVPIYEAGSERGIHYFVMQYE